MSSVCIRQISRSLLTNGVKLSLSRNLSLSSSATRHSNTSSRYISRNVFLQIVPVQNISLRHFSCNCVHLASSKPSENVIGDVTPRLAVSYKCKICGTRNTQTFSRKSYTEGVVIVQCVGCKSNHLIADNLGWFDDIKEKNIEGILAAKGEQVQKLDSCDIPPEILEKVNATLLAQKADDPSHTAETSDSQDSVVQQLNAGNEGSNNDSDDSVFNTQKYTSKSHSDSTSSSLPVDEQTKL